MKMAKAFQCDLCTKLEKGGGVKSIQLISGTKNNNTRMIVKLMVEIPGTTNNKDCEICSECEEKIKIALNQLFKREDLI